MQHPIMFRDDDFGLRELREIALGFPGSFEKVSWGRPVFCAPKIFAMYGAATILTLFALVDGVSGGR
jgi:hypothetical protein